MKNLKIKFGFFSLLTLFACSIFLTSCEQELDVTSQPELLEVEEPQPDDISETFRLPKEFSGMSDEEIVNFLENTSEEELSNIIIKEDIEMRGCDAYGNSWIYLGKPCKYNVHCNSGRREIKLYKKKCIKNNWFDSWIYAYGSWYSCC